MPRPPAFATRSHEIAVGRLVALHRRGPRRTPWKVLEHLTGVSAPVLRRAMGLAAGRPPGSCNVVSLHENENFHFPVCGGARATPVLAPTQAGYPAAGVVDEWTIRSMNAIFSSPKPQPVSAPPATPTREDPAVQEARASEIANQARQRGRRATLITGGQGASESAPVTKKRLFGE